MRIGPFTPQDHVVITTLGLEFALAVAVGTAGGYWADRHWHWTPWGTVAGVVLGFALGMYILIRQAGEMARADQAKKEEKKDGSI